MSCQLEWGALTDPVWKLATRADWDQAVTLIGIKCIGWGDADAAVANTRTWA